MQTLVMAIQALLVIIQTWWAHACRSANSDLVFVWSVRYTGHWTVYCTELLVLLLTMMMMMTRWSADSGRMYDRMYSNIDW